MTWYGGEKRKGGQYRCQPEEEIIALLFLHVFLSLSPPSLSLCGPNLVWCQTSRLADREEERGNKREEERILSLLSLPLSLLPLSLSLLGANNYSFLCHQLEQSTPLSQSLSPCICVHAWAFAAFLTIIRSTQADSRSVGTSVGRYVGRCSRVPACVQTHGNENNTHSKFNKSSYMCVALYIHEHTSSQEPWGFRWISFFVIYKSSTHTHTGTYDYRHVNMVKNA